VLIESFRNEEDIHRRTAAEVFAIAPEDVTREMRDRAKAVNFGIIYGISDYGLSRQLGISRQESRAYIERYLERYPGVCEYIRSVVEDARRQGYVTTILNRRRYLPEINSRNFTQRSFAERTAMNTPIQGSAADIIKLAMLQVEAALRPFKDAASMILQVHDELVFEVEEPILAEVARLVREKMERAMELLVPLTVDLKSGLNWAEMIKLNE
jgi:DNA polymerase-1